MNIYGNLMVAFTRTGLVGFGGGPSMIPLIQHEVVKRYQWMNEEEFGDVLAIANVLPGPIATKLPGYVGYRIGGALGALLAVVAITLPMIIGMIVILGAFAAYRDVDWVRGMSLGVVPVVAILMLELTWQFLSKSWTSIGWIASGILILAATVVLYVLSLHPALMIIAILAAAILLPERVLNLFKGKKS